MQVMIEVFDFASDASHKSCYRNTVTFDCDSFPYDDFKKVFSILYPYKYITFTIVPNVKPVLTKK